MAAKTLIIVLVVVVLAGIGFVVYNRMKKAKPAPPPVPPATPQQLANIQLASDAHQYATKKWCQSLGLVYNPDTNNCSLQEEQACKRAQTIIENKRAADIANGGDGSKYPHDLEWHPEVMGCVRVFHQVPQICTRLGQVFGVDGNGMPYEQPLFNYCDDNGRCDDYIRKFPRCKFTEDYCKSKGLSVKTLPDGSVDCYIPEGQEIGEGVLGSYFVRKFRKGVTSDPKSLLDLVPVVAGYNAAAEAIEKIL